MGLLIAFSLDKDQIKGLGVKPFLRIKGQHVFYHQEKGVCLRRVSGICFKSLLLFP